MVEYAYGTPTDDTLSERGHSLIVVHIKLSTRVHDLLKAVLSLEGSTMQAYFAAQAEAKIAQAARRTPRRAAQTLPVPPAPAALVPGQTSRMPTGRSMHWCAVCGTLWRSGQAQPVSCGHRRDHAPSWRTGTTPDGTTPRAAGARAACTLSATRAAQGEDAPVVGAGGST